MTHGVGRTEVLLSQGAGAQGPPSWRSRWPHRGCCPASGRACPRPRLAGPCSACAGHRAVAHSKNSLPEATVRLGVVAVSLTEGEDFALKWGSWAEVFQDVQILFRKPQSSLNITNLATGTTGP